MFTANRYSSYRLWPRCAKRVCSASHCVPSIGLMLAALLLASIAHASSGHRAPQLTGDYVFSMVGSFKSAPPPFTGPPLTFDSAILGVYSLDPAGHVEGEHTLVFSNAAVPFDVVSRIAISGEYTVDADGHVTMHLEEDSIEGGAGPDGIIDNTFTLECRVVQSHLLARCVMHTLVTYQQGPEPRLLPSTLSGTLERQR